MFKYQVVIIIVILSSVSYSQEVPSTNIKQKFSSFRAYESDRYYTPFQDPRSFISKILFSKNYDFAKALTMREPNAPWKFRDISVHIETKIASEILFYRNYFISVGLAASMDVLIFGNKNGIFGVYDFYGQFAPYIDFYTKVFTEKADIKIRLYPVYHQSSHYVDGYKADTSQYPNAGSYEFLGIWVYYRLDKFLFYNGYEITYHHSGNSIPLFRIVFGTDFRLPLLKNDINLITGINIGAIYHEKDLLGFVKENTWSPAINFGVGVELYRYTVSLKISYQRPYGATTYFKEQFQIGGELGFFL